MQIKFASVPICTTHLATPWCLSEYYALLYQSTVAISLNNLPRFSIVQNEYNFVYCLVFDYMIVRPNLYVWDRCNLPSRWVFLQYGLYNLPFISKQWKSFMTNIDIKNRIYYTSLLLTLWLSICSHLHSTKTPKTPEILSQICIDLHLKEFQNRHIFLVVNRIQNEPRYIAWSIVIPYVVAFL